MVPKRRQLEIRIFRNGNSVLTVDQHGIESPIIRMSMREIPVFEATIHRETNGVLCPVDRGDTIELWVREDSEPAPTRRFEGFVDFIEYSRDRLDETIFLQARCRLALLMDRSCEVRLLGQLDELIDRLTDVLPDKCIIKGLDAGQEVSAHVSVGSRYAALRAIAVSLGASLQHDREGKRIALVARSEDEWIFESGPAVVLNNTDVEQVHYSVGRRIKAE